MSVIAAWWEGLFILPVLVAFAVAFLLDRRRQERGRQQHREHYEASRRRRGLEP